MFAFSGIVEISKIWYYKRRLDFAFCVASKGARFYKDLGKRATLRRVGKNSLNLRAAA